MNFLKSVYVVSYISFAIAVSIFAAMRLADGGHPIIWVGVLLTTAPFMLILSWIMLVQRTARTSQRFPVIIFLAILGLAMALLGWNQMQASILGVQLASGGLLGFLIYTYWYSSFNNRSSQIEVGKKLPDFTLTLADGSEMTSEQLRDRPSILMFYRGNWCPLCMAQVRELSKRYQELEAANVRTAMISPQPHKNTISLAKKFNVGFEFYTDRKNKAARALGIANKFGVPMGMQVLGYDSETVLPTVIITDANGKVIWLHETDNYRVRPEPDVFMAVLRQHGIAV
ncbi:MAG: alkyl hydroperoxide reductase [Robiginitomaculum sp.]|nr:MAG: alkyl hydroperoxide reductase [Robiginitomaculum sp.]